MYEVRSFLIHSKPSSKNSWKSLHKSTFKPCISRYEWKPGTPEQGCMTGALPPSTFFWRSKRLALVQPCVRPSRSHWRFSFNFTINVLFNWVFIFATTMVHTMCVYSRFKTTGYFTTSQWKAYFRSYSLLVETFEKICFIPSNRSSSRIRTR